MADTETPSSAPSGSTRVVAKRAGTSPAPRKRAVKAAKKSTKTTRTLARKSAPAKTANPVAKRKASAKAPARHSKNAQTAAIIALATAAAAGAVYALRKFGWGGKAASLALLNKDVRRVTAEAVKSLVEKTGDLAEQAGQLAGQAGKKGRNLLSR